MVELHNMLLQRSSVLQFRSNWLDIVNSTQNQPFPSTQAACARHSRGRISSRSVELRPEWHQAFAGLQRDKCFCQKLGGRRSYCDQTKATRPGTKKTKKNKSMETQGQQSTLVVYSWATAVITKETSWFFSQWCLAEGQKKSRDPKLNSTHLFLD